MDAAVWNDGLEQIVGQAVEGLSQSFAAEPAINELRTQLNNSWKALCNSSRFIEVALDLESRSLQDLVSSFSARMQTANDGETVPVDRLSDGLRSLLYFAIIESAFKIEQDAMDESRPSTFDADSLAPPELTLFAIEEPETHLAPHLLGRVLKMFRRIAGSPRAQAVFSSHSASVLSRIEPQEVRHLRLRPEDAVTQVSMIELPEDGTEADKFVREAVRAFPELYFARLVVLGEGDSEQVVLARLLQANELESDPNVISVVPLGGRHVNHLWRLLNSLSIPYLTLLDLDCEREGGGWGRIHYVCNQLRLLGYGDEFITLAQLVTMPSADVADATLNSWIAHLEKFGVYFSTPLDLDFSMLRSFTAQYSAIASGNPHAFAVDDATKKTAQLTSLLDAVLGLKTGASKVYTERDIDLFRWYRYFFLNGSKPATHMAALSQINDELLIQNCPSELSRFFSAIKQRIGNG
ncbi:ATP-dependent nuclease [Novipirellula rosea]|uniref:ATP-dependent nuclease n=1 Tax=Novipirellula rosea TaxID=1031540 RepID=UPI0031E9237B